MKTNIIQLVLLMSIPCTAPAKVSEISSNLAVQENHNELVSLAEEFLGNLNKTQDRYTRKLPQDIMRLSNQLIPSSAVRVTRKSAFAARRKIISELSINEDLSFRLRFDFTITLRNMLSKRISDPDDIVIDHQVQLAKELARRIWYAAIKDTEEERKIAFMLDEYFRNQFVQLAERVRSLDEIEAIADIYVDMLNDSMSIANSATIARLRETARQMANEAVSNTTINIFGVRGKLGRLQAVSSKLAEVGHLNTLSYFCSTLLKPRRVLPGEKAEEGSVIESGLKRLKEEQLQKQHEYHEYFEYQKNPLKPPYNQPLPSSPAI